MNKSFEKNEKSHEESWELYPILKNIHGNLVY